MRLVTSVLAMLLPTVPAAAGAALPRWNPRAPENSQLVPGFDAGNVSDVLKAIGARSQRSGSDPSKPVVLAVFANGRKAQLSLSGCNAAGTACKALSIQSFWVKSAKVPPERTAKAIEQFNHRYAFAKAFVTADGRPSLQRYLTADYGYVRGNLAVNLLAFADQAERLAVEFLEPLDKGKN